jgi:hypothetical protein
MKVQELLNDESKWHKGDYQVDKKGCIYGEPVKWCLMGAIMYCYKGPEYSVVSIKVEETANELYNQNNILTLNDDPKTTFDQIRKIIEKANV